MQKEKYLVTVIIGDQTLTGEFYAINAYEAKKAALDFYSYDKNALYQSVEVVEVEQI